METETLDINCPLPSMELDYHSHIIDSDMVSPQTIEPDQYDYDQVMMTFENDPKTDDHHQLEIEMLDDDHHSSPIQKSLISAPASPLGSTLAQANQVVLSTLPDHTLIDSNQQLQPFLLPLTDSNLEFTCSESYLPSIGQLTPFGQSLPAPVTEPHSQNQPDPSSLHLLDDQDHQSSSNLSSENDPKLSLEPPSFEVKPVESCNSASCEPTTLHHPDHAQVTREEHDGSLPIIQPAPSSSNQAYPKEVPVGSPFPATTPHQLMETEEDFFDGDQKVQSGLDRPSTQLDESVAEAVQESNPSAEEEGLGAEPQWENAPLMDEIPYEDYDLDSRPKVRTELLEHVRVGFESVSLNDDGLPVESDLASAPSVRLICEGCEYSLFQRMQPDLDSNPVTPVPSSIDDETILLSEVECHDLYYSPLEALIQSLHNIFPNLHNNNKNEIVLNFPALEIKVPEDNIYSKEISLFDVDRLHIGARLPGRLLISLEKQPRLVHRFNVLATYVSELAEHRPDIDENPGVCIEEVFDAPAELLVADNHNDGSQPEVSEMSRVPEGSPTDPTSITPVVIEGHAVFLPSTEASGAPIVTSSKDKEAQPFSIHTTSELLDADGPGFSSLAPIAGIDQMKGELESTTDDLAVSDISPAIQLPELLPLATNTDQLSHEPDQSGLQTQTEVGDAKLNLNHRSGESVEEVSVQLDCINQSQGCNTRENFLNEIESSNSELTIRGVEQLSEGEIEEFIVDESPSVADSALVHDPDQAASIDEGSLCVTEADPDSSGSAHVQPIPDDSNRDPLLPTGSLATQASSKRSRAEVEDTVDDDEPASLDVEAGFQHSDVKKARVF